jgi:hypothetical protein
MAGFFYYQRSSQRVRLLSRLLGHFSLLTSAFSREKLFTFFNSPTSQLPCFLTSIQRLISLFLPDFKSFQTFFSQ